MTATHSEILERLEACESDLAAHRGYLKAMEYGLRAIVIAHPAPEHLKHVWAILLPAIADAHIADHSTVFTAGFQQALALLGEQIEAAGR